MAVIVHLEIDSPTHTLVFGDAEKYELDALDLTLVHILGADGSKISSCRRWAAVSVIADAGAAQIARTMPCVRCNDREERIRASIAKLAEAKSDD